MFQAFSNPQQFAQMMEQLAQAKQQAQQAQATQQMRPRFARPTDFTDVEFVETLRDRSIPQEGFWNA